MSYYKGPRKFKYTYGGGSLSECQRQFYEDNGFIVIRNNVDHALLDEEEQRFLDICNGKVDAGFMTLMKDQSLKAKGARGERLINKIQDWLYDDVLFKYATYTPIVDVIESIVGPDITAAHSMLINKPPDSDPSGSLHPLHQDLHYFPFRPAERVAASWTAMEKIGRENGGLYVIPGTHKSGLHKHDYPEGFKTKLYHTANVKVDHLPRVDLVMDKGDTVFFHPLLLHGSGPNSSKGFRKAISCHYVNSNSHFIDIKGTSHEKILTEYTELMSQNKGVTGATYMDLWKLKSRLVRGNPGIWQNLQSSL